MSNFHRLTHAEQFTLSEKTTQILKEVHRDLSIAGWKKGKTIYRSAMFSTEYSRNNRHICLEGWHGEKSRGYGDLKLLFGLSDDFGDNPQHKSSYPKPQLNLDVTTSDITHIPPFYLAVKRYITSIE